MKKNYLRPQTDIIPIRLNSECCLVTSGENLEEGDDLDITPSSLIENPLFVEHF